MPPLEPALALIIIVLGGLGITGCEAESSSAPPMKHYFMTYTFGKIVFACHAERVTVDVDMCEAYGERLRCRSVTAMPVDAGALFFYPAQSLTKPIPVTHGLVCAPSSIPWRAAAAAAAATATAAVTTAVAAAVSPDRGWLARSCSAHNLDTFETPRAGPPRTSPARGPPSPPRRRLWSS